MIEKATMESKTKTATWKSIKTYSETGAKNDFTFCLGPPIKKTNSGTYIFHKKGWKGTFQSEENLMLFALVLHQVFALNFSFPKHN